MVSSNIDYNDSEKIYSRFHFFISVLMILFFFSLSCFVPIADASFSNVTVDISFPKGGERLNGIINIAWEVFIISPVQFSSYVYYSLKGEDSWHLIPDSVQQNNIQYRWDTSNMPDGIYQVKISLVFQGDSISFDTSDYFIIDNDNSNLMIRDIKILRSTDVSVSSVRNGDDIRIEAFFENAENYKILDISADLDGLGFGVEVRPDSFDGQKADWILNDVKCQPLDGRLEITVQIGGIEKKDFSLIADNTNPNISILRPTKGIYIMNRRIIPFPISFNIGSFILELDIKDAGNIIRTEIFVDTKLEYAVDGSLSNWSLDRRLFGKHSIRIVSYDGAGNKDESLLICCIFNI